MTSAAAVRMAGRRTCAVDGRGLTEFSEPPFRKPTDGAGTGSQVRRHTSSRARSSGIAGSPSSARTPKPSISASVRSAIASASACRQLLLDRRPEPLVHARVELRGGRAQLGVADGAQPQLDPQHPVALLLAGQRQALVDHRPAGAAPVPCACACRRRARTSARAPRRAGPRGWRSGSARARSRRRRPSRCGRSARASIPSRGDPVDRRVEDPLASSSAGTPRRPCGRSRAPCPRRR